MEINDDYWHAKWNTKDIAFHQDKPHPQLVKHFSNLPQGKVIVPLCGKTLDMLWLQAQGHSVVGIELSALACIAFFDDNRLPYTKAQVGELEVYSSGNISIWCGDFFKTPNSLWEECTAIYDRAALVALPEPLRKQYVAKINWAATHTSLKNMILITVEHTGNGPPFSISADEVQRLYGAHFHIEKKESKPDEVLPFRSPRFKGFSVAEHTFLLSVSERTARYFSRKDIP